MSNEMRPNPIPDPLEKAFFKSSPSREIKARAGECLPLMDLANKNINTIFKKSEKLPAAQQEMLNDMSTNSLSIGILTTDIMWVSHLKNKGLLSNEDIISAWDEINEERTKRQKPKEE